MSKPVTFAIAGCGSIGKRHVAVVDADPKTALESICDVDAAKVQQLSALYQQVPYYTSFAEQLKHTTADIVSICTPHAEHTPMALQAIEQGKHVLVEKPMALTVADCKKMIDAAKAHQVKLMVVKQNRFNVPIKLTKQVLDEGLLGKIYMVQCHVLWNRNPEYYTESSWRGKKATEGGALFTQVSHFIDLLIWWFGDVVEAKSLVDTKLHDIEIEDCGSSTVNFASGVMGTLIWTTCVYNKNFEGSITIIGEKGTIKIGGPYLNKIDFWDVKSMPLPNQNMFVDQPNMYGKYQGTSSNHDKVIAQIANMFSNEKYQEVVEGEEGIKSIEAIEKMYQFL